MRGCTPGPRPRTPKEEESDSRHVPVGDVLRRNPPCSLSLSCSGLCIPERHVRWRECVFAAIKLRRTAVVIACLFRVSWLPTSGLRCVLETKFVSICPMWLVACVARSALCGCASPDSLRSLLFGVYADCAEHCLSVVG